MGLYFLQGNSPIHRIRQHFRFTYAVGGVCAPRPLRPPKKNKYQNRRCGERCVCAMCCALCAVRRALRAMVRRRALCALWRARSARRAPCDTRQAWEAVRPCQAMQGKVLEPLGSLVIVPKTLAPQKTTKHPLCRNERSSDFSSLSFCN